MTLRYYGLSREDVRKIAHRHVVCMCSDKPRVMINHSPICDSIRAAIREALLLAQRREQAKRRRRKQ